MSADTHDTDFAALRASLLSKFEAELREQHSIDAASRESMLARMEEALRDQEQADARAQSANASEVRSSVAETIDMLNQHGLLDDGGGRQVQHAFSEVYSVFENDAVAKALEFARISREDGEHAARAWLAARTAESNVA